MPAFCSLVVLTLGKNAKGTSTTCSWSKYFAQFSASDARRLRHEWTTDVWHLSRPSFKETKFTSNFSLHVDARKDTLTSEQKWQLMFYPVDEVTRLMRNHERRPNSNIKFVQFWTQFQRMYNIQRRTALSLDSTTRTDVSRMCFI